jgi:hypothetical protein
MTSTAARTTAYVTTVSASTKMSNSPLDAFAPALRVAEICRF